MVTAITNKPGLVLSHALLKKIGPISSFADKLTPFDANCYRIPEDRTEVLLGGLSPQTPVHVFKDPGFYCCGRFPENLGEASETMMQYLGIKEENGFNFHKIWFPLNFREKTGEWIYQIDPREQLRHQRIIPVSFCGTSFLGEKPLLGLHFNLRLDDPQNRYWIVAGLHVLVPLNIKLVESL